MLSAPPRHPLISLASCETAVYSGFKSCTTMFSSKCHGVKTAITHAKSDPRSSKWVFRFMALEASRVTVQQQSTLTRFQRSPIGRRILHRKIRLDLLQIMSEYHIEGERMLNRQDDRLSDGRDMGTRSWTACPVLDMAMRISTLDHALAISKMISANHMKIPAESVLGRGWWCRQHRGPYSI